MKLNLKILAGRVGGSSKKYTRKQLLEFYPKAVEELGHEPSMGEMRTLKGFPSNTVILDRFKTWNRYKKAAGGKIVRVQNKYSDKKLLELLRKDSKRRKKILTPAQMQTIAARFGGMRRARELAGLEQKYVRYTNKELIQLLRKARKILKRVPTADEIESLSGFPSSITFKNHFGSWNNALKTAGLKINNRKYSDKELIDYLVKAKRELGKTPSTIELIQLKHYPSPATYIERFGSWDKALEAAGLEIIHRVIVYSDKELIKILKKFNRQNGRLPLSKDMKRINGYPSIEVYMNRFGSWNKALLAAGLDLNNAIYSDKELIKLLRKAAKVLRKPYIATHLKKLKNYPSPKTFRKRFGNWDKALKAAGLKN